MVQANELRLGNFIICNNEYALITCVSNEGVSANSNANAYVFEPFESINPVHLSPELMNAAGFKEKTDTVSGIGDYSWYEFKNIETIHVYKNWITLKGTDSIPIKYLHQLQNIYFALTGTELKITL